MPIYVLAKLKKIDCIFMVFSLLSWKGGKKKKKGRYVWDQKFRKLLVANRFQIIGPLQCIMSIIIHSLIKDEELLEFVSTRSF